MTDTQIETPRVGASFVWAPDWERLSDLASVAACCPTDNARPLLTAVHLFRDGADLVAEATDSYVLGRVRIEAEGDASPDVLIPARWLRDVLRATKPRKLGRSRVMRRDVLLSITLNTITASSEGVTMTTDPLEGNYPSVGQLIPTAENYKSELGAFDPHNLARMAEILPGVKHHTAWRCVSMTERTAPALWEATAHGGEGEHAYTARAQFLVMPVRIS